MDLLLDELLRWGPLVVGALLVCVAINLTVKGLRGVPDTSRRRCPKCGFDRRMSTHGPCAECGDVPRSPTHLHPRRRGWCRSGIGVVLGVIGAFLVVAGATVRDHGWTSIVPSRLLLPIAEATESRRTLEALGALPSWDRLGRLVPRSATTPAQDDRVDVILARQILSSEGGDRWLAAQSLGRRREWRGGSRPAPTEIIATYRELVRDSTLALSTIGQNGLLREAPDPWSEDVLKKCVIGVVGPVEKHARAMLLNRLLERNSTSPGDTPTLHPAAEEFLCTLLGRSFEDAMLALQAMERFNRSRPGFARTHRSGKVRKALDSLMSRARNVAASAHRSAGTDVLTRAISFSLPTADDGERATMMDDVRRLIRIDGRSQWTFGHLIGSTELSAAARLELIEALLDAPSIQESNPSRAVIKALDDLLRRTPYSPEWTPEHGAKLRRMLDQIDGAADPAITQQRDDLYRDHSQLFKPVERMLTPAPPPPRWP